MRPLLILFGAVLFATVLAIDEVKRGMGSVMVKSGMAASVFKFHLENPMPLEMIFDNDVTTNYEFSLSLSPNADCTNPIWDSFKKADEHAVALDYQDMKGYVTQHPSGDIYICMSSTASVDVKVNFFIFDGYWLHLAHPNHFQKPVQNRKYRHFVPMCSTDTDYDLVMNVTGGDDNDKVFLAVKKTPDAKCDSDADVGTDGCVKFSSQTVQALDQGKLSIQIPESNLGEVFFVDAFTNSAQTAGKELSFNLQVTYDNVVPTLGTGANTFDLLAVDHCYSFSQIPANDLQDAYDTAGLFTEVGGVEENQNIVDIIVSKTWPPLTAQPNDVISTCTNGVCELNLSTVNSDVQEDPVYVSLSLAGNRSWLHLLHAQGGPPKRTVLAIWDKHTTPVDVNEMTGWLSGPQRGVGTSILAKKNSYTEEELENMQPIFLAEVNHETYEPRAADRMTSVYLKPNPFEIESMGINYNNNDVSEGNCGVIHEKNKNAYFHCWGMPNSNKLMNLFWVKVALDQTAPNTLTRFLLGYTAELLFSPEDHVYSWDSNFLSEENFFLTLDLKDFRARHPNDASSMFITAHANDFLNGAVDVDIFADFSDPGAMINPEMVSIGDGSHRNSLVVPGLIWNNKVHDRLFIRLGGVKNTITDVVVTTGAATISIEDGVVSPRVIGNKKLGFIVSPSKYHVNESHVIFAVRPADPSSMEGLPSTARITLTHSEVDGYVDHMTKDNHHASISIPISSKGQVERFHLEVTGCDDSCNDILADGIDILVRATYYTPFVDSEIDVTWNPDLHHLKSAKMVAITRFNLPSPSDARIEISFPKALPDKSTMTLFACHNDVVVSLDAAGTNLAGDICMKTVIPAEQSKNGTPHSISISATHHNVKFGHWYLTAFLTGSSVTITPQVITPPNVRIMTSNHLTLGQYMDHKLSNYKPTYFETHGLGGFGSNTGEQVASVLMRVRDESFKPETMQISAHICVSTRVFHPDVTSDVECDVVRKTVSLPVEHSDATEWDVPPLGARYHVAVQLEGENPVDHGNQMLMGMAIANRRMFNSFNSTHGYNETTVHVCETGQNVYIETVLPDDAKNVGAFIIAEPTADPNNTAFIKYLSGMSVTTGDHLYPNPGDGHVAPQVGGTLTVPVSPATVSAGGDDEARLQIVLHGTHGLKGHNGCADYNVRIYADSSMIRDITGYRQSRLDYKNVDILRPSSFMITTNNDIIETGGDFDIVISPCRGSIDVGVDYRPMRTHNEVMMPIVMKDHRQEVSFGLKEVITQHGQGVANQIIPRFTYFVDVNTSHVPIGGDHTYSFQAMITADQFRPYITNYEAEPVPTVKTTSKGDLQVCFEPMVVDSQNVNNEDIEYAVYIVDDSVHTLDDDPLGWNVNVACGLEGAGVRVTAYRSWKELSGEEIKVGTKGCVGVPGSSVPRNSKFWVNVVARANSPYPSDTEFTNSYKAVHFDSGKHDVLDNVGGKHFVLKTIIIIAVILIGTYFFLEFKRNRTPGYQSLSGTKKDGVSKPLNIGPRTAGSSVDARADSVLLNSGSLV